MKSKTAAMRGKYALVIDFTGSDDLPEYLNDYYDEDYFIEIRTLFKDGKESRTQWIFRDENYGVRLIAVLIEAEPEPEPEDEDIEIALDDGDITGGDAVSDAEADTAVNDTVSENIGNTAVIQNTDEDSNEIAEARDDIENDENDSDTLKKPAMRIGPARGFIEIYDEKYNLVTEYRYSEKGGDSKIEYLYNENKKISSRTMIWDYEEGDYIQAYTDYYRYNRSSFLRAVERVFLVDQQITAAENVIASVGDASDDITDENTAKNTMKVSFPYNILAAAKNNLFMGERFNEYPEFFGNLFAPKNSKLIYTTDKNGKVLEQTLVNEDGEQKVIWKIVNTWSKDRIVKITKTEGETVYLAEYEYNKNGDRILERNIKDGVLERVVRLEGKLEIEELYLDNKLVLRAVWEDGRKISESRVIAN